MSLKSKKKSKIMRRNGSQQEGGKDSSELIKKDSRMPLEILVNVMQRQKLQFLIFTLIGGILSNQEKVNGFILTQRMDLGAMTSLKGRWSHLLKMFFISNQSFTRIRQGLQIP